MNSWFGLALVFVVSAAGNDNFPIVVMFSLFICEYDHSCRHHTWIADVEEIVNRAVGVKRFQVADRQKAGPGVGARHYCCPPSAGH